MGVKDATRLYQPVWNRTGEDPRFPYQRESASRYLPIRELAAKFKRPFSVLDIGSSYAYFDTRLMGEFDCCCIMVDNKLTFDILGVNGVLDRSVVICDHLSAAKLEALSRSEHFDIVLGLSVLHHFDDPERAYKAMRDLGWWTVFEIPGEGDVGAAHPEKHEAIRQLFVEDVPRGETSVDVEQYSDGKLLEMWRRTRTLSRQGEDLSSGILQDMSCRVDEKAQAAALAIEQGTAQEGERKVLREYLFESGGLDETALRELQQHEQSNAPRELQSSAGSRLAVSGVPPRKTRPIKPTGYFDSHVSDVKRPYFILENQPFIFEQSLDAADRDAPNHSKYEIRCDFEQNWFVKDGVPKPFIPGMNLWNFERLKGVHPPRGAIDRELDRWKAHPDFQKWNFVVGFGITPIDEEQKL